MTEKPSPVALAACPFCGGEAKLCPTQVSDQGWQAWVVWRVGCMRCLALGPTGGQGDPGRLVACQRWNLRRGA